MTNVLVAQERAGKPVKVVNLTKRYGDFTALGRVSFEVPAGEFVVLLGANGAGKSTLFRCLVRLLEPTEGEVYIGDDNPIVAGRKELRRIRSRVGVVSQQFHLVPRLSAYQNTLHGALSRLGRRGWWSAVTPEPERVEAMAALERVGLAHLAERRVDSLSGGEQQRVAVARMLMQRPTLVLADEPVASLDPAAGVELMELLREIAAERGMTVFAALHQLEFARRFATRLIGLVDGRLVLDEPADRVTRESLDSLYGSRTQ